jgi:transposase
MSIRKNSKALDFDGQRFDIGIDTHDRNWSVTIRSNKMLLKKFSMNPSSRELSSYMNRHYPGGEYYSVYEAGFCGYWIYRELTESGIKNIIVNPADVPTTNKEKIGKRDPIDSNKLSRELGNGSLECIFIPTPHQQAIRSLSRLRFQQSKRSRQVKNYIKEFLHFNGIRIPVEYGGRHWSRNFIRWLQALKFEQEQNRQTLDLLLVQYGDARKSQLDILRVLRKYASTNETIHLLRTIPGIGFVTAFTLYAELLDIKRFSKFDKLAAIIGLIPEVKSTDDKQWTKGIASRKSVYLRYLLVEAAWIAIRKDPVLTKSFSDLTRRMTKNNAIIRIAKKLLSRVRYVWANQKPYVLGIVE